MSAPTATAQAVIAEARRWLGTPYHSHARVHGVGVDCAQLLLAVFGALGLAAGIDPGNYPRAWHLHHGDERYAEALLDAGAVETAAPQPGCIALYWFGRTHSHSAICTGAGAVSTWVHAYLGRGVIETRSDEEPLQGHAARYFIVPGVATGADKAGG